MGIVARWKSLPQRHRAAILIGTELVLLGLGWSAIRRSAKTGRLFPRAPKISPNVLGFDSEESDEPMPDGLVFDNEPPCRPASVSLPGMQGDGGEFCLPPADLEPLQKTVLPFAEGGPRPIWPLATHDDEKLRVSYEDVREIWHGAWGRHFGATRKSTDPETKQTYKRYHVGVDLFADPGDVVLSPEDGEIIATLPFFRGTGAVYLLTDSGIVVNLGEVQRGSWRKFGISDGVGHGTRVFAGQPVARIGETQDGSHMLHVETYRGDATTDEIRGEKMRWVVGDDPPQKVLDPTRYLVRAQRVHYETGA